MTTLFAGVDGEKGILATDTRFYKTEEKTYRDNFEASKIDKINDNTIIASSGHYLTSKELNKHLQELDNPKPNELINQTNDFLKDKQGQERLLVFLLIREKGSFVIAMLVGHKDKENGDGQIDIPYKAITKRIDFGDKDFIFNPGYEGIMNDLESKSSYKNKQIGDVNQIARDTIKLISKEYWYCGDRTDIWAIPLRGDIYRLTENRPANENMNDYIATRGSLKIQGHEKNNVESVAMMGMAEKQDKEVVNVWEAWNMDQEAIQGYDSNGNPQVQLTNEGKIVGMGGDFELDGTGLYINTNSFKLDKQGNAEFSGNITSEGTINYNNLNVNYAVVNAIEVFGSSGSLTHAATSQDDWNELNFNLPQDTSLTEPKDVVALFLEHNNLDIMSSNFEVQLSEDGNSWSSSGFVSYGETWKFAIPGNNGGRIYWGYKGLYSSKSVFIFKRVESDNNNTMYMRFKRHSIS